jgi:type II secretory ATPase GspE/PulE/Tfp pilus assembly ATPase PilB-like protein
MVGEIRDNETAVTAVRAANTGHLVLATTHASQSSRAIETMLFLGVHPYFLATSLLCVIAQVLVRRICPECQTPLPETADMILDTKIRKRLGKDADANSTRAPAASSASKLAIMAGPACSRCSSPATRPRR